MKSIFRYPEFIFVKLEGWTKQLFRDYLIHRENLEMITVKADLPNFTTHEF